MLAYGPPSLLGMLVLLFIILLLFSNRLPALARSIGQSVLEFKKGLGELEDHSDDQSAKKDR